MTLLLDTQRSKLIANGMVNETRRVRGYEEMDFAPVVKLFCPGSGATWLLTELDPEDHDLGFGLCDLGLGFPELGHVRISELEAVIGPLCLPIERDRHFKADKTLEAYADEARTHQRIVA